MVPPMSSACQVTRVLPMLAGLVATVFSITSSLNAESTIFFRQCEGGCNAYVKQHEVAIVLLAPQRRNMSSYSSC